MVCEPELIVIGAGLAGSEAAWQAAQRGVRGALYEMLSLIHISEPTRPY